MDSKTIADKTFIGDPVLAPRSDGCLQVFAIASDGSVWRSKSEKPNGDDWTDWSSLGGIVTGGLGLTQDHLGHLVVFARGTDTALWEAHQADDADTWTGWSSLGGTLQSGATPSAALNGWGGIQVFVRWNDDSVKYFRQDPQSDYSWTSVQDLGGVVTSDPVVAADKSGRLSVFALGTDTALYQRTQS
jgi:hypothetical protein